MRDQYPVLFRFIAARHSGDLRKREVHPLIGGLSLRDKMIRAALLK
jgi:hypothetical protein